MSFSFVLLRQRAVLVSFNPASFSIILKFQLKFATFLLLLRLLFCFINALQPLLNNLDRAQVDADYWLINYIGTKAKYRYLKNWYVKRLCGRCESEFIDWRYSQSCWYFQPRFVNYCLSNLLSGSTAPPFLCQSKINTDVEWPGGGWGLGVLSSVGDHILQEFKTMYFTRFRTYKIARPPQTKT